MRRLRSKSDEKIASLDLLVATSAYKNIPDVYGTGVNTVQHTDVARLLNEEDALGMFFNFLGALRLMSYEELVDALNELKKA